MTSSLDAAGLGWQTICRKPPKNLITDTSSLARQEALRKLLASFFHARGFCFAEGNNSRNWITATLEKTYPVLASKSNRPQKQFQ